MEIINKIERYDPVTKTWHALLWNTTEFGPAAAGDAYLIRYVGVDTSFDMRTALARAFPPLPAVDRKGKRKAN